MIRPNLYADNYERNDSRNKIIEAATILFSEKGFHAVSVKEICQRARVNISAISYHFGGKEGLLRSMLNQLLQGPPIHPLPEFVDDPKKYRDLLKKFLIDVSQFYRRNPPLIRLFFKELGMGSIEAARVFKAAFAPLGQSLKKFIESGKRASYLKFSAIPSEVILLQLLAPLSELYRCDPMTREFYGWNGDNPVWVDQLVGSSVDAVLGEALLN